MERLTNPWFSILQTSARRPIFHPSNCVKRATSTTLRDDTRCDHVHRLLHPQPARVPLVSRALPSALLTPLSILASNRDEYLDRPTLPARWHRFAPLSSSPDAQDEPPRPDDWVLSGRDHGSPNGGTWLGVTRDLRVAVLCALPSIHNRTQLMRQHEHPHPPRARPRSCSFARFAAQGVFGTAAKCQSTPCARLPRSVSTPSGPVRRVQPPRVPTPPVGQERQSFPRGAHSRSDLMGQAGSRVPEQSTGTDVDGAALSLTVVDPAARGGRSFEKASGGMPRDEQYAPRAAVAQGQSGGGVHGGNVGSMDRGERDARSARGAVDGDAPVSVQCCPSLTRQTDEAVRVARGPQPVHVSAPRVPGKGPGAQDQRGRTGQVVRHASHYGHTGQRRRRGDVCGEGHFRAKRKRRGGQRVRRAEVCVSSASANVAVMSNVCNDLMNVMCVEAIQHVGLGL